MEQALHLADFVVGRAAALGRFEAHHPDHQRGDRHVGEAVDALGDALQRVEPLGERDPVPEHAGLHRVERDCLGAGHGEHGAVAFFGPHGGEAEAAVAKHDGGDAVPAGDRAVGVPLDLGVVVGVEVDEAGRDDQPFGVEHLVGVGGAHGAADLRHAAVFDADIGLEPGHSRAIDHRAALDQDIELGHLSAPVCSARP